MTSSAESLARQLADITRRLQALERGTQLTTSTVGTSAGTVSVVSGIEAGVTAGAAAAEALLKAASAEAKADGAVHTYFGPTPPEQGVQIGDLWRNTEGVVHQFDGTEWVPISSDNPELAAEVEAALDRIAHAEEALDGKVTTYFVPSRNAPPEDILNVGDLWIVSDGGNLIRRWNGTQWVDAPAGAGALADRAVTSTKLETDLVLSSRIVAGPEHGTHAEMATDGFRVFTRDPLATQSREVIRLGVDGSDDYFAVTDTDGVVKCGITEGGMVNGSGVNATGDISQSGRTLNAILDDRPKGVVAWAQRTSGDLNNTTAAAKPYLRLDCILSTKRLYKVWTSNLGVVTENNGCTALINLGVEEENWDGTNVYTRRILTQTRENLDWKRPNMQALYTPPAGGVLDTKLVSFILDILNITGNGKIAGLRSGTECPVQIVVEDVGPAIPATSVEMNNTADKPSVNLRKFATFTSSAVQNYVLTHDTYNNVWQGTRASGLDNTRMYQGKDPEGRGNLGSIALFPDMTATLSGKKIVAGSVHFQFEHWYYSSGGTARISAHGHTTMPDNPTFYRYADLAESPGWPRPGDRWIPLPPAMLNGLQTGAMRGVALVGDDTYESYGYAKTTDSVDYPGPAVLEIEYFDR